MRAVCAVGFPIYFLSLCSFCVAVAVVVVGVSVALPVLLYMFNAFGALIFTYFIIHP